MTRSDWLDYADHDAVRAEYLAGPQDLEELAPGVWGIPGIAVICVGDRSHMRKVQAKRFHDKFIADPGRERSSYYGAKYGGPPLPPVAERLGFVVPKQNCRATITPKRERRHGRVFARAVRCHL